MTPMTSPDTTYCDRIKASMRSVRRLPRSGGSSALRRQHEVAGLELRWIDDLGLGEGLLGLRVLEEEHGRRPLLPVRALAARESDRPVPADELVREERLDDVLRLVGLAGVHGVGEQHHLRIGVEAPVDRLLLELLEVTGAEGLPARRQLHGRVVVDDEGGEGAFLAQ